MADIRILPLTPERLPDHLAFFDGDAFADNPRWAFCYCNCLYADHAAKPWTERSAAENRAAVIPLIQQRQYRGYLAYAGDKVVGWCNAGPKRLVPALLEDADGDVDTTGALCCFLLAQPWRGQGIARRLLEHACADFAVSGLRYVEAYPRRQAQGDGANHFGPLAMYLSAGFSILREDADGGLVVRKAL